MFHFFHLGCDTPYNEVKENAEAQHSDTRGLLMFYIAYVPMNCESQESQDPHRYLKLKWRASQQSLTIFIAAKLSMSDVCVGLCQASGCRVLTILVLRSFSIVYGCRKVNFFSQCLTVCSLHK